MGFKDFVLCESAKTYGAPIGNLVKCVKIYKYGRILLFGLLLSLFVTYSDLLADCNRIMSPDKAIKLVCSSDEFKKDIARLPKSTKFVFMPDLINIYEKSWECYAVMRVYIDEGDRLTYFKEVTVSKIND
jgi:hypothetical protein